MAQISEGLMNVANKKVAARKKRWREWWRCRARRCERENQYTQWNCVCVCVGTLNSHSNISISGHTFYRLMIENGVIKLKDRNGSAQGEIEITTIFIPCVIFFFRCCCRSRCFVLSFCLKSNFVLPSVYTFRTQQRWAFVIIFMYRFFILNLFDYLLEWRPAHFFVRSHLESAV